LIQLFEIIRNFDFGGIISFFRFLGFFEKNLKPKNCVLGVKNEKNQKTKCGIWKEIKTFFYESVLFLKEI